MRKKTNTVQGIDMVQIKNNTNIAIMYNVVSSWFFRLYSVSVLQHCD